MPATRHTDPADRESLRLAVEGLHGCSATFSEEIVTETFQGQTAWDGVVHAFALLGHPQASACYAWSSPVEGSENRRIHAVLKVPPVDSAAAAVRVSIVEQHRASPGI